MSVKSMGLVWWHKVPCMGVSSLRVLLCCRYQCSNEAEVWCQWRPVWESPQAGWLTPHTDSGLLWALRYLESQVPPPLPFHLLTFWGYEKVMSLIRNSTSSVYLKVKGWIISESLWGLPFLAFFVGTLRSRNDANIFLGLSLRSAWVVSGRTFFMQPAPEDWLWNSVSYRRGP